MTGPGARCPAGCLINHSSRISLFQFLDWFICSPALRVPFHTDPISPAGVADSPQPNPELCALYTSNSCPPYPLFYAHCTSIHSSIHSLCKGGRLPHITRSWAKAAIHPRFLQTSPSETAKNGTRNSRAAEPGINASHLSRWVAAGAASTAMRPDAPRSVGGVPATFGSPRTDTFRPGRPGLEGFAHTQS